MKPTISRKATKVVESLLTEAKGGADLSTEDLRQAYLVDFTGDPGFDDSYFLRHRNGQYEYKILGNYGSYSDNGQYYVTSFFVKPSEGPHGDVTWSGDFPGITDIDTDDLGKAKEVFNAKRPKTKWSASLKKRPAQESLLQEKEWKLQLGIDLNDYDEDQDVEEIKNDLVAKLKAKVEDVRRVIGKHDGEMLDSYIMNLEDAVENDDIDAVMADIYDWADAVDVWVGGGPGDDDGDEDVDVSISQEAKAAVTAKQIIGENELPLDEWINEWCLENGSAVEIWGDEQLWTKIKQAVDSGAKVVAVDSREKVDEMVNGGYTLLADEENGDSYDSILVKDSKPAATAGRKRPAVRGFRGKSV